MKANWVVDTYMFDSVGLTGDMLQAIRDSGCDLHETKHIPFTDDQDYGPPEWVNEPTILYGTHGFIKKCKIPFIPGAYGHNTNTNCNIYYNHLPKEWMLNKDCIFMPFGMLKNDASRIFKLLDTNAIFLRPVSGFKTFAGFVVYEDEFEFEMNSRQQLTSVIPETMCLISAPKKIQGEFRFIVVNNEVVDGSCYRWDDKLDVRHDWDNDCLRLAKEMSRHEWQPDSVYTCDVALCDDGPWIIELNSFACAGLYACDKPLVVNRVTEFAKWDFQN